MVESSTDDRHCVGEVNIWRVRSGFGVSIGVVGLVQFLRGRRRLRRGIKFLVCSLLTGLVILRTNRFEDGDGWGIEVRVIVADLPCDLDLTAMGVMSLISIKYASSLTSAIGTRCLVILSTWFRGQRMLSSCQRLWNVAVACSRAQRRRFHPSVDILRKVVQSLSRLSSSA